MNKFKYLLCAFAIAVSGLANAALDPIENVLELSLLDLRMPAHEADSVVVRMCEACEASSFKVTAETEYRIGGFDAPVITLQAFKAAVRKVRDKDDVLVYLGYEPDTNNVKRLVVSGDAG